MASAGFAGVGSTFLRGIAAVAEIISITGPNLSKACIDISDLNSTSGYREFIGGFKDSGEVTLEMKFTYTTWNAFKGDFDAVAPVAYSIVFSDTTATTFAFNGVVTGLTAAIPMDDKVTSSVTIKIAGPITVTA